MPHEDSETPRTPRVSVVVPTRDRATRLEALISSLRRQTVAPQDFELIVVDDGSADRTAAVLDDVAESAAFAVVRETGGGTGPAAARNLGWRRARADLVAFTDDDCEPEPEWLETALAAALNAPGAIVQGRTDPIAREFTRPSPRLRTKRIEGPGPWYQTCNILYPRSALEALGGFDETFTRPFGEDADLAWRAIAAGVPVRYEPAAVVRHAVEELTPSQLVRSGLRDPDEALIFKRHPALRGEVARLWIFKSDHHALLPLAAIGLAAGARRRVALALSIPYVAQLALRTRGSCGTPIDAALLAARDVLEIASAVHGAIRHRVLFL